MSDMLQTIFSAMIGLLGAVAGALATWYTMRWRILREGKCTRNNASFSLKKYPLPLCHSDGAHQRFCALPQQ